MAATGDPAAACRSRVEVARALPEMPLTREAFGEGAVSEARVRLLTRARETAPEAFGRDEPVLVAHACTLSTGAFPQAVQGWQQQAHPEGAAGLAERLYQRRRLHISPSWEGMVHLDGDLDPESGTTVMTALASLTDHQNLDPTDPRTPAQRRADALTEICRRHLDASDRPSVGGERPHLTVTADLATLERRAGHLAHTDGGPISPEDARRLACDAQITRIITRGKTAPLELGRRTRVVPAPLRRALDHRDRGCTHPGCGTPARWCDTHHLIHWADGGKTELDNLRLLCRRHHRAAHHEAPYRRRE